MTYHIVAIPQKEDLEILNNLRNHIYQNNFRFKNKPITSDTHMTLAQVDIDEEQIDILKQNLLKKISEIPFEISNKEWILTKEDKEANYKIDKPYTWIALKFPKRKEIYTQIERVIDDMGINRNDEYIENVKKIEGEGGEYIANHINLSNYTRQERAQEAWNYFNNQLPNQIVFDTLALRDLAGNHVFEVGY